MCCRCPDVRRFSLRAYCALRGWLFSFDFLVYFCLPGEIICFVKFLFHRISLGELRYIDFLCNLGDTVWKFFGWFSFGKPVFGSYCRGAGDEQETENPVL